MSTKDVKASAASKSSAGKKRLTAAERAKAMKTKSDKKAMIPSTRLTEADKALDTDVYILNSVTNKHVKRNSAIGQKILAGETPAQAPTPSEILTNVVRALQQIAPDVLTNAVIKRAIVGQKNDEGVLVGGVDGIPRTFPSEWGGRGKKPRHPDKPKGAKNAYIIFATEMRPKVRKDNPNVPNSAPKGETSITSIIGQLWEQLKDRSEYEKKAAADLARYEEEMTVFESAHPECARKSSGIKKQTRTNGYRVYCDQNREQAKTENPNKNGREINSFLAERWNALNEADQKPFKEIATERNAELPEPERKAKPVAQLSEAEQTKARDTDNFILNPETGRYVKRASKIGRKVEHVDGNSESADADLLEGN